jgi:2,4'-dihydroxyacetophenone dioxygenase
LRQLFNDSKPELITYPDLFPNQYRVSVVEIESREAHRMSGRRIVGDRAMTHPAAVASLFISGADCEDERLWVPVGEGVAYRPLFLSVSQGLWTNVTRIRRAGIVSRHRHVGAVHGHTLKGSWRYLEEDWVATPGSYIFEPPGDQHTLVVDAHAGEMMTIFQIHGAMIYLDEAGATTGVEDVFTRIDQCRAHFESVGLGSAFADQFIR